MARVKVIDPVDAHAGQQLRERREKLGISQENLGKNLSPPKSPQQIQHYESGHNRMGFSIIWRCSQLLGVDPNYFAEGLNDNALEIITGKPEMAALAESKEARILISHYIDIPDEDMRQNILLFTKNTAKTLNKLKGERNG